MPEISYDEIQALEAAADMRRMVLGRHPQSPSDRHTTELIESALKKLRRAYHRRMMPPDRNAWS